MILDITYFTGELYLPNLKLNVSDPVGHSARTMQTIGENDLGWYVAKYEEEFLIALLGIDLYDSFINGLGEDPINQIWTDLKNAIYKEKDGYKFSPAANYVFYWVSRRGRTQTATNGGEVVGTQSYSKNVEDADKLAKAWNDMCDMVESFYCDFLSKNWNNYRLYSNGKFCRHNFKRINKWNI